MDIIYEEREAYCAEIVPAGALRANGLAWPDSKLGIILNAVLTPEQWSDLGNKINTTQIKTMVLLRFALGDWYNHLASEKRGTKKQAVLDALGSQASLAVAKTCGWVANKWPIKLRGLAGDWVPVWSFYKWTAPFDMDIKLEALELWMKGGMTMDDLKEFLDQERPPKTAREQQKAFILQLARMLVKDDDIDLESLARTMQDYFNAPTEIAQPI